MAGQPQVMVTRRLADAATERMDVRIHPPARNRDPELLRRVEAILAEHIGPVARVIVRQAVDRAHSTVEFSRHIVDAVPPEAHQKVLEALDMMDAAATPSTPDDRTTEPVSASTDQPLDNDDLRKAEAQLAVFLGPFARLLVKRTAKQTGDRRQFYRILAGELSTPEEREKFLQAVQGDG
jgi:hypothetical protein